jgi:hypothetical protein
MPIVPIVAAGSVARAGRGNHQGGSVICRSEVRATAWVFAQYPLVSKTVTLPFVLQEVADEAGPVNAQWAPRP